MIRSDKQVLGKHTLNEMMAVISKAAELSMIYTNHCVRSTVVTVLNEKGFDSNEIKSVTGHKRTESIERYNKRMRLDKKKELSNALTQSLSTCSGLPEPENDNKQRSQERSININAEHIVIREKTETINEVKPTLIIEKNNCKVSVYL